MKINIQRTKDAKKFVKNWLGHGYEKGEAQKFWIDLLTNVFGVKDIANFIFFEERVKDKNQNKTTTNYIDAYIPSTKVMIENKPSHTDLQELIKQSDGRMRTSFQQARDYISTLPLSKHPKWVVTCNFNEFQVYDMENPNGEPEHIFLKDLEKEYFRLQFLVDENSVHITKEMQVSMRAGEIVGEIYDALLKQYGNSDAETLRWLNILCVRIVFCLYAEDAGMFRRDQFHDYIFNCSPDDIRRALQDLFKTLNTPVSERSRYLKEDLAAFPYTNGGLFVEEIEIPMFTEDLKQIILQNASADFDWSEISPTIFGAVFESTLNPETRRKGGMHYTSIANIHKVIDPLFLDELKEEFRTITEAKTSAAAQRKALHEFQQKISSLTFLDPACGSGNFLTETYISLRRLENELILEMTKGQMLMGFDEVNPVKVSIHQFYGIEINDFAVDVAKTALWIAENQMLIETEKIIDRDLDMLPLKSYANIRKGNALRESWMLWSKEECIPNIKSTKTNIYPIKDLPVSTNTSAEPLPYYNYKEINLYTDNINFHPKSQSERTYQVEFDYIMGNPPFVGYTFQSAEQKEDLQNLMIDFGKNLDYVSGWYFKAAQITNHYLTKVALVSTNSITQGEQVSSLWKNLFERFNIHIDFAHRTFRWDSESEQKAHVHCVIIGFSGGDLSENRKIFSNNISINANNINPYLLDAPTIFIENRKSPLCDVPEMQKGSIPVDGGHLIIEENEYEDFVNKNPLAKPYIHPLLGADEFISGKKRFCLWLINADPSILKKSPGIMERLHQVREMRLASPKSATRQFADFPTRFMEIRQPATDYLLVPSTTSENRRYIPIGYLSKDIITTNANFTIGNASLYHFGVLTSYVHMAWMRVVCGRLKSDYRYSNTIVYNNFPWPSQSENHELKIQQTAQAILDVRAQYPNSSLADLYDEVTMPPELRKAHTANDKAVMEAYGFDPNLTEDEIVAELFKLYQKLTAESL